MSISMYRKKQWLVCLNLLTSILCLLIRVTLKYKHYFVLINHIHFQILKLEQKFY